MTSEEQSRTLSQNYRSGSLKVVTGPTPSLQPGGVLVRTAFSVISSGTELMKVREAQLSYLGKARARPEQARKVIETARQQGPMAAYRKAVNKLDSMSPLGYSTSGIVTAVGAGVSDLHTGQQVACAGAGYANHADVNFVPGNLVVPVPEGLPLDQAAFATVGSIALQGYRQAEMQLGEVAVVIGLGLIGQLLSLILRSAGMQTIGIDLSEERCELATRHAGMRFAMTPHDQGLGDALGRTTVGGGADCVFITAGGPANDAIELAIRLVRDRGRIVDIGKTGLDLQWNDFYEKEVDLRFSRSYGPGRYDPSYEERGIDYPVNYVRWTERRNLSSFLQQLASGRIDVRYLISAVHDFSEAERVLESMAKAPSRGLAVLFRYPRAPGAERAEPRGDAGAPGGASPSVVPRAPVSGQVRIGVIGAGNYASSMLLPAFKKTPAAALAMVATRSTLSSLDAARKFEIPETTTSADEVIDGEDIDVVLIATRHATHAELVDRALRAGKTVFVEKPLSLSVEGLESVRRAVVESGNTRLFVGFNRRFSPPLRKMADLLSPRQGPLQLIYRISAGLLDPSSWYNDEAEGSRFVGEGGHFIDTTSFLVGARPQSVWARSGSSSSTGNAVSGDLMAVISYADGSTANIVYSTRGGSQTPKEVLEVLGAGRTLALHNFDKVEAYMGTRRRSTYGFHSGKGQAEEVEAFVQAVQSGGDMPISIESLLDTTLTTLACEMSRRERREVQLAELWSPQPS
ncbi:MAG: bi-domain-containing oxidoreductase [Acidimicrobiales bacterium]